MKLVVCLISKMSFGIKTSFHWKSYQKHSSIVEKSDFLEEKMLFNCWVILNFYHRPKIERWKPKIPQDGSFVENRRKENTRSRLRRIVDDELEKKLAYFF